MKKMKLVLLVSGIFAAIILVLFMNKQKLSSYSAGGIKEIYYVSVAKAEKKNLTNTLSLVGIVFANNDVNIISETAGKITAVYTKVGDYKKAGSVLFQVDDELKQAAFKNAEANYEKAKKDYDRSKELFEQKSLTESQLDLSKLAFVNAETQYIVAKRQLEDTKIKTPISGYITAKYVDLGSMVQGAPQPTLVANIVDISKVKVKLNVSENDIFNVKHGQKVEITSDAYPNIIFFGTITSVSAKGDEAHTFPIEISAENHPNTQLKAGMFAKVNFNLQEKNETTVIPRASIIGSVKKPQVFVVENGIAKIRSIKVGQISETDIQVLSGINPGEVVVVNGQNNITDNTKVEILK